MFILYSFLLLTGIIIASPYFLLTMIFDKKYYDSLHWRLGKIPNLVKELLLFEKNKIWIHTVSVGEFLLALPIIKKIKQEFPNMHVVVTTTTKTGNNLAKEKLSDQDTVLYSPLDFSFIVKKFLKLINPKILIIIETELWPNLIKQTFKRKTPIILLNARISDKSFGNYQFFSFFFKKVLEKIKIISTRSNQDYNRFLKIGAKENQTTISGNIKFDICPEKNTVIENLKNILPENKKVFIAGSTHEKEEEYILESFKYLEKNNLNCTLILAPRHPERIPKIENLIKFHKIPYIKKSQLNISISQEKNYSIILIDTIGELFSLYSLADFVFIGGSLIPHGGHNILEPAYFGKPIIFGQYMSNFKDIADSFIQEKAALCVSDSKELSNACFKILTNKNLANKLGKNARAIISKNQGAFDKSMIIIKKTIMSD